MGYVIYGDSLSPVIEMKKRDFKNFGLASFRERKVLGYEIKTLFRYYCEIDCFKEEPKSIKKNHSSKGTVINLKSITTSKNYKLFINLNEHIRRRNRGAEYAWCFVHSLDCFLK